MSQNYGGQTVWGFFKFSFKAFVWLVRGLQAVIGLVLLLIFATVILGSLSAPSGPMVPAKAALVVAPAGVLVEQAEDIDPVAALGQEALGGAEAPEVEVGDIVEALRRAAEDDRITAVVLKLQDMLVPGSSASKAHLIAREVEAVRAAGKPVVAVGDYYDQSQYLIASHADTILLNPLGDVVLYGYSRYGTYFKSLLDRLEVTMNVFRVGTYKAAVEPFIRDDMSPEAKEANLAYLNSLWAAYTDSVEPARGLPAGAL
ncbi:MAG: S49 family peptidase, partial [Pseudomonadota bacterium]